MPAFRSVSQHAPQGGLTNTDQLRNAGSRGKVGKTPPNIDAHAPRKGVARLPR